MWCVPFIRCWWWIIRSTVDSILTLRFEGRSAAYSRKAHFLPYNKIVQRSALFSTCFVSKTVVVQVWTNAHKKVSRRSVVFCLAHAVAKQRIKALFRCGSITQRWGASYWMKVAKQSALDRVGRRSAGEKRLRRPNGGGKEAQRPTPFKV